MSSKFNHNPATWAAVTFARKERQQMKSTRL